MAPLLQVKDLRTYFYTEEGVVKAVDGVTYDVEEGETLALVGESGCGKSVSALALLRLIPIPPGRIVSGEVLFDGEDLLKMSEEEIRHIRGNKISMVFQEPMTSLNPVMRVGAQIEEASRAHEPGLNSAQVRRRTLTALDRASVPEPDARAEQFPHQLSGGLRQRVMIAMALAGGPRLLIADEPTTALDVTVQKQILQLLDRLRRELKLGLLFITHDLGVVAQVADRVAVLYAGRIMEEGPADEVLAQPLHPYTEGLLAASPRLRRATLTPIPGSVPRLDALPPGCAFEPRCAKRLAECAAALPELRAASSHHAARCILVGPRA